MASGCTKPSRPTKGSAAATPGLPRSSPSAAGAEGSGIGKVGPGDGQAPDSADRRARDVVEHFDGLAEEYHDTHGPADRLLAYRLAIIRGLFAGAPRDTFLEIGCGTGIHLLPLAGDFSGATGIDVSPAMVRVATRNAARSPHRDRISVGVDSADLLATIPDGSVDVVLCVGALEHILDKRATARQVQRVLSRDGVFVCLTPNGGYCWYRFIAPLFRMETRHLSTDRFLAAEELVGLVEDAGLAVRELRHWRFVPRGDMPGWLGTVLVGLDRVGETLGLGWLRGGLAVSAVRPAP